MVTGLPVESLAGLWTQHGLSPALSGAFPVAATAIFGGIKQGAPRQFRRRAKPEAYWGSDVVSVQQPAT